MVDPNISLSYRPPQFQMPEIQTPLERFGKVLSLRNLMTQGEMGQLQLDQARLAAEQQKNLADLIKNYSAGQPTQGAVTPPQTMMAPPQQPGSLTGATQFAPVQQPQDQTGTPLIGYDPATGTLPAQSRAPAPVVAPPVPATATTVGGLPQARLSGLPSDADILRAAPGPVGLNWIKTTREMRKADLEEQLAQLNLHKGQSKEMSDKASAIIDNETKNRILAEAGQNRWIPWDQVRQFSAMDFSDPRFQSQLKQWQTETLGYDKTVELRIKEATEKRNALEADDKQQKREYDKAVQDVYTLNNAQEIPAFVARQGPYAQAFLGRIAAGASDLKDFQQRVLNAVNAEKIAVSAATGLAAKEAELGLLQSTNAALVDKVLADPSGKVYSNLPPEVQKQIAPTLAARGYTGFTTKPTDTERKVLQYYQRAQGAEDSINKADPKTGKTLEQLISDKSLLGKIQFQWAPNMAQTAENQQYWQALRLFTTAMLRKESGAVIAPHEYADAQKTYFPVPGDLPPVLEQKRQARQQLLQAMQEESGPAYTQWKASQSQKWTPERTSTGAAQAAPPGSWPVQVTKPGGKPESMWMGPDGKTYELPPEPPINTKKPVGRYNPKTGKIEAIP